MKRIKVETIYHVADNTNEVLFADRIIDHIKSWVNPEFSRNTKIPHYESCLVSVENKNWADVVKDNGK